MKKAVTTILLLTALLFGFAACGGAYMDPNAGDNGMGGGGGGGGGFGGGYGGGGGAGGGGTLTITGIPQEHEGKYVLVSVGGGSLDNPNVDLVFVGGFQSVNANAQTMTLSTISNGKVVVPLWDMTKANSRGFARYSGTAIGFVGVFYQATQTLPVTQLMTMLQTVTTAGNVWAFDEVSFRKGSASVSWSEKED